MSSSLLYICYVLICMHVRTYREWHKRAHETCTYTCVCVNAYIESITALTCPCAYVRARECRMVFCTNVRRYRRLCIKACTDAQMRTRTRASAAPSAFVCLPYPRACAYVWMYVHACMDGSAWTGVNRYACTCIYITISISLLYIYMYSHVCMYVGMWVCMETFCTQVSMRMCTQTDATRIDRCT